MLNLATYLDQTAAQYPDTTAVIMDDFKLSYAELAASARRVASILQAKGVGPGDKVAMMAPNIPQFPIIYYGILHAGAVVVPVNSLFRAQEIKHYISDSEAVVFFAFEGFEEAAHKAFLKTDTCHDFIIVETGAETKSPVDGDSFTELMAQADASDFDTVQTQSDDTAVLLYTSGTTGAPKGAVMTHSNMFMNALYVAEHLMHIRHGEVMLTSLPLFHSFGQTVMMNCAIMKGGTMSLMARYEARKALTIIERDKIALIALVPSMYGMLLGVRDRENYDISSVRLAVSGGAALPEETHARFQEAYGITILEGYGLSETSPVACFSREEDPLRVGSIGKPIWGVEMGVMSEDNKLLPAGEVGEVVVRGHNIMKGYYNRPEATREAIVNGWFHTGDLGKYDEEGYFYIVDRKKDLIIRGGMNIYPREIEEVLYGYPKVNEAAVIGIPNRLSGEEVKAIVCAIEGETIDEKEIRTYLKDRLADYKQPKTIEIRDELPKGPTGKILKRVMREEYL